MLAPILLLLSEAALSQHVIYDVPMPARMEVVLDFDEPAGPLLSTVTPFVHKVCGYQLLFNSQEIGSYHSESRSVVGRMRIADALAKFLDGLPLVFEVANERTLVLVPAPPKLMRRRHAKRVVPERTVSQPECTCVRLSQFAIPTPWCWDGNRLIERRELCEGSGR